MFMVCPLSAVRVINLESPPHTPHGRESHRLFVVLRLAGSRLSITGSGFAPHLLHEGCQYVGEFIVSHQARTFDGDAPDSGGDRRDHD